MASATSAGRRGETKSAHCSSRKSRWAGISETTRGQPHAIASRTTFGNPSYKLRYTNASAHFIIPDASATNPGRATRSEIPSRSIVRWMAGLVVPSPARMATTCSSSGTKDNASTRLSTFFCSSKRPTYRTNLCPGEIQIPYGCRGGTLYGSQRNAVWDDIADLGLTLCPPVRLSRL